MNLIQHSSGPWFWWNEECAGQAVADGRFLTGSVTPVANPYVFKTRIVIPPSVLADVGLLTITPYAVLELQPTVNWPGSGQTLVDQALSPASGWVTMRNGNAPLLLASFGYATAPTLPEEAWGEVAVPSLMDALCGDLTTAIRWPNQTMVLDPTKSLILETVICLPDDPGTLLAGPTYPVELPVGWWVELGGVTTGLVAAQAYDITESKCVYDGGIDDGSACWLGGGSEGWNAADWAGLDRTGSVRRRGRPADPGGRLRSPAGDLSPIVRPSHEKYHRGTRRRMELPDPRLPMAGRSRRAAGGAGRRALPAQDKRNHSSRDATDWGQRTAGSRPGSRGQRSL